jgi:hypothetical protein
MGVLRRLMLLLLNVVAIVKRRHTLSMLIAATADIENITHEATKLQLYIVMQTK